MTQPPAIIDSSAVVALLTEAGDVGEWVHEQIAGHALFAPDLLPYEVSNILRRHLRRGIIDVTTASLAHTDLLDLAVHLDPYLGLAERIWALRDNVSGYDAGFVALAERRQGPLITLDEKLASSPGPTCEFRTPATTS